MCLYFSSNHGAAFKTFALVVYIVFLLISVVPIFGDTANPPRKGRRWSGAMWSGIHSLLISWIVTGFGVAALGFQVRKTLSRPSDRALSRLGLVAQATVFALVAVSSVVRVEFPWELLEGHRVNLGLLCSRYELVGWAAIDNAIFALGQAVLLWITSRLARLERKTPDDETEPLLRDSVVS